MARFFLFVFLLPGLTNGQSVIQFVSNAYSDVLNMAVQSSKPVFIDVYTEWCGPCKRMDKQVFNAESVAARYNANFINLKIDAEKGEGIEIAGRYGVKAYPTYLYLNGFGEVVYRVEGFRTVPQFLRDASIAMDEYDSPKKLADWEKDYHDKKTDKEVLYNYTVKRLRAGLEHIDLVDEYFSLLSDEEILLKSNLDLVADVKRINPNGATFQAIARNFDAIKAVVLIQQLHAIHSRLDQSLIDAEFACVRDKDDVKFEKVVLSGYSVLPGIETKPWLAYSTLDSHRCFYYRETRQFEKFMRDAPSYLESLLELTSENIQKRDQEILEAALKMVEWDPSMKALTEMVKAQVKDHCKNECQGSLISSARFVFENSTDPAHLEKAYLWAQKANAIGSTEESTELLDLLRVRLGK